MKNEIKILIISENEDEFIVVKHLLVQNECPHYSFCWASTYHEGSNKISEEKHDIYLVDYALDNHNGLDLIRESKSNGCDIPFILFTKDHKLELDMQALKVGASDYLVKGTVSASILERSIRYSIEQAKYLKSIKYLNIDLGKKIEEIKLSEERYYNIFKNSMIAMFISDLVTEKTVYANEMGVAIFGYKSLDDFLENYDAILHFNTETLDLIRKAIRIEKEVKIEMEAIKLSGHSFWIELSAKVDIQKNLVQTIILDITQRKSLENLIFQRKKELENKVRERTFELTKSLEREKQLHELKSNFVSMASHEFRTPLATMLSSLALVKKYDQIDEVEKKEKHLNKIESNIHNLTELLEDFLSIGKLENGQVISSPESFNACKLVSTLILEFDSLKRKGQTIAFNHRGDEMVCLDKKLFRNSLLNLISNAIKFSKEDSMIVVESELKQSVFEIKVKDNGIGISEIDQEHLFERFFRGKNATNVQGTGLGLSIIAKYMELMNGTIEVTSEENKGTEFKLTFTT